MDNIGPSSKAGCQPGQGEARSGRTRKPFGKPTCFTKKFQVLFTLKYKLVLLFLIFALTPLLVSGFFSIRTTEMLINQMVLRQLKNVAADKAILLERWLDERRADLQVMASTSIVAGMDPLEIGPYLNLIQSHYGVYKDITVVSKANEVVFSSIGLDPTKLVHLWSQDSDNTEIFMSGVTYLPGETESSFQIAAPIVADGEMLGTVFGTVGTNTIITIILQVALGKTGECYLVDSNGVFLAHKEPKRILAENISQSDSFRNIFGTRDPSKAYLDYRGIEVLGISSRVGRTGWYIVVEQDSDEAFQSLQTLKGYIFFTILLCTCSTLFIIWIISWHIVHPIRLLSQSAKHLSEAEPLPLLPRDGRRDEIGVLSRAFENMAQKVLDRSNELEQKVYLKEAELKDTDITLKQIKLIAERSEKFAAIGRLGAAVAHEIRTPLASLKLFMESVEADISISPEFQEDFDVAMAQVGKMEDAINRFLDFSKPQALDFQKTDIITLIQDVVSMVKPMANKQECTLNVLIQKGLPTIQADRKFLEEAMVNLLVNALEAILSEGSISVSAGLGDLSVDERMVPCVRIDICDNGKGINPEHLDLIFDSFFTTKKSGTGLGLPLVRNTIKRHGGDIQVSSIENQGTVFSVFLPV
ncbi:MAG: HAMP domain-containing protein [Desulfatibacillum sp.]|nr:HAMP domain-containing protein [Desulfatibacillum sp.]